jgi:hypothetical protein
MKLTKNEIMNILNGGGLMKVTLSHAEKLEVVRRFELHGMIEEPKFAIVIPDVIQGDFAAFDKKHGWMGSYEKDEIISDTGFHFTMDEIDHHEVLSKLKHFIMEVN